MAAAFVLRMFGAMKLESGSESLTKFPTKRSALILARLAISKGNSIGRDELAETLWPDDFLDQTRLRLRQELRRLRQAVGEFGNHIRADRLWVELEPGSLRTDVQMFDEALAASQNAGDVKAKAQCLSQAVAFLNGPFLAGFQEPWVLAIRRDYDEKARRAWLSLADAMQSLDAGDEALGATLNAVRHAPLDLDANTSLIRRYVEMGQISQARQAFFEFDAMMSRELGRRAPASVRAALTSVAPDAAEEVLAADVGFRTVVKRPLPLFGRTEMLESIQAALSRPNACVALVGTVGIGKTHLIREAAWQFSKSNDLPVRFGGVSGAVTDGLFVVEPQIDRESLVVSIKTATELGWRVLAESRIRLDSDGITEILVSPLPIPALGDEPAAISANPSVQILMSKVSELGGTATNELDVAPLAEIARQLDGLPSALRLFASRLMIQTSQQVLQSLDDGLTEYAQLSMSDGETVTSAVSRLTSDLPALTQDVLLGLSLLDGASVDLATKLAEPQDPAEVWRALEKRCLITVQGDGMRRRYKVPNPVAFAVRNLAAAEKRKAIESKTWKAACDWAFERSRKLGGEQLGQAFSSIQAELPNLLRGTQWAIDVNPELAGLMVVGVWRTVCARGNPALAADLLFRATRVGCPYLKPKLAGEAWLGTAIAMSVCGRLGQAEEAYLEALRIFEADNYPKGQAWVLINYADSVVAKTDISRASELSKRAADLTTEPDDRWIALGIYALWLADLGQTEEAIRVGEEVFANRLQSPDLTEQARAYGGLAQLYRRVGRSEAAHSLFKVGIDRLRSTGIQDMLLDALLSFAEVIADPEEHLAVLAEASALAYRIGSNAKLLEIARSQLALASQTADRVAMVVAIEDAFRLAQVSQSRAEREQSLRALAAALDRLNAEEYANTIRETLGEPVEGPVHAGWKALLSSDSHVTICVLAVVMAKEAMGKAHAPSTEALKR